jgi:hypothetical protein
MISTLFIAALSLTHASALPNFRRDDDSGILRLTVTATNVNISGFTSRRQVSAPLINTQHGTRYLIDCEFGLDLKG